MEGKLELPQGYTIRRFLDEVRTKRLLASDIIQGKPVGDLLVQYEVQKYEARKRSLDAKKQEEVPVVDIAN